MATALKGAKGWEHGYGDAEFFKFFGPLKATVRRHWPVGERIPTEFRWNLTDAHGRFDFGEGGTMIATLGADWFDDECEVKACKACEEQIKAVIRSWTKPRK